MTVNFFFISSHQSHLINSCQIHTFMLCHFLQVPFSNIEMIRKVVTSVILWFLSFMLLLKIFESLLKLEVQFFMLCLNKKFYSFSIGHRQVHLSICLRFKTSSLGKGFTSIIPLWRHRCAAHQGAASWQACIRTTIISSATMLTVHHPSGRRHMSLECSQTISMIAISQVGFYKLGFIVIY